MNNPPPHEIFSFANLHQAYKSCLSGKIGKKSYLEFELDREKNLLKMSRELQDKSYKPGQFTCFAISDPKLREVWAADFKDRIIHHLLVSKIEPIWEKIFIHDSYACRTRKGAHKAVRKIKKIIATEKEIFYLHMDVRGFFTSIDKDILFSLIHKNIKNPDLIYLVKLIIFHDPKENYIIKGDIKLLHSIPSHKSLFGAPSAKGLPIGNHTSQFFANVYLNELDQYAKRRLKCKNYFRYMDDILILDRSQSNLRSFAKEINVFIKKYLKLELHPKKTILQKAKRGIDFLGYIIRPDYALSRKRVVGNIKMKLERINLALQKTKDLKRIEEIALNALCVINSYWGHFKHGDCENLKRKLYLNNFGELQKYLEKSENGKYFVIKNGVFPKKNDAILRDD